MIMGDDDGVQLPSRQPSTPIVEEARATPATDAAAAQSSRLQDENESIVVATAPQTRAPRMKPVQADSATELQNRDLGEWTQNYLANMAAAHRQKQQYRAAAQGKRNAAFWILAQGIGGVQADFGDDPQPHPLAVFSGQTLLDALTGTQTPSPPGSKRERSDSDGSRRVRPRTDNEQGDIARGNVDRDGDNPMGFEDDGIVFQGDNDAMPEEEVGRRADSALSENASIMPWNSSSRQGSAIPLPISAGFGVSSSIGGGHLPGSRLRSGRTSRLPSASPLTGKGPRLSSLDPDGLMVIDPAELQLQSELDMEAWMGTDEFEQFGPAAAVDTQTAQTSQWMRATLENEAMNFLGFTVAQIAERREGGGGRSIVMDELLPPKENSAIVGAQALLHVLSLTTKGWLSVEQEEAFGAIVITVFEEQLAEMVGQTEGAQADARQAEGGEDMDEGDEDEPDEL
jgi:meiotic recombination protein REC8, fungi type